MLHSKLLRIILLLVIISSLVLIAYSLWIRMGSRSEPVEEEILSEEVIRRTTEFEHSQLKNGKVLFRVISGSSTMVTGGDNILERVSLWRFNQEGGPSDMIEGERAVYNPEAKKIKFTGDVIIRLENGLLVYADQVQGDLETEILEIREDYRMEYEAILGRGTGLEYVFPRRDLHFTEGIELVFDQPADHREASAGKGFFDLDSGRIILEEEARVENFQSRITGQRIEIDLDGGNQIKNFKVWERARFSPGDNNFFSGDGISVDNTSNSLTILGSDTERAFYRGGVPENERRLSADAIYCSFGSGRDGAWKLEKIKAEGKVEIEIPAGGVEECRGGYFEGHSFPEPEKGFREIFLSKNVFLARVAEGDRKETIVCRDLHLKMDGEGRIQSALADHDVLAEINSSGPDGEMVKSSLKAEESIEIVYEDGSLRRATGNGGCDFNQSGPSRKEELKAGEIRVIFQNGLPRRAAAEGEVSGRSRLEELEREFDCNSLGLFYSDGHLSGFEMSGGSSIRESNVGRKITISSERITHDTAGRILKAEGGRPVMIVDQENSEGVGVYETRARKIIVERSDNLFRAEGQIESIYDLESGTLVFVSDTMSSRLEEGLVEYQGNVRLMLDKNVIRGNRMQLNSATRDLVVEGAVDTRILAGEGVESDEYRIMAESLNLSSSMGTATYRNKVRFESEDLNIEAPVLVLFMEGGDIKEFSRLEAWGGVKILEEGRTWTGEKAVYSKETGKVRVDGE